MSLLEQTFSIRVFEDEIFHFFFRRYCEVWLIFYLGSILQSQGFFPPEYVFLKGIQNGFEINIHKPRTKLFV